MVWAATGVVSRRQDQKVAQLVLQVFDDRSHFVDAGQAVGHWCVTDKLE